MDIRNAMAAQNYAATKAVTGADPAAAGGAVFDTAKDFITTLQQSEANAMASMTADSDPHTLVHSLAQTELAVQSVVAVRDKVVEAYQELLRMPI